MVFQAYGHAVPEPTPRLQRLAQALQAHVQTWRLRPVVAALQALRGVQFTAAVTVMAEREDLARVAKPRQLRRDRGLTPSASSTGDHRRQGAITKTGHAPARRARLEGAWAYRYPANVSQHLQWRLETLPPPIQAIRWKAQVRRCQRYRPLIARGKHATRVVVAIARDLSAWRGAIAPQGPGTP